MGNKNTKNISNNEDDINKIRINIEKLGENKDVSILSSKTIKEITLSLLKDSNIKFLNDQQYLSSLIDNIKFYIYITYFAGCTNENSLRIYEYSLFVTNEIK
jgi:hypothetical protein